MAMVNKTLISIFILSILFYIFIAGINSPLKRDPGIYLYSAQRVAEGIPPYVGIFDHKGPGAPLMFGGIIKIIRIISPEINHLKELFFLRMVLIILSSFIPVFLYLISKEFLNEEGARITALAFLSFLPFSFFAAAGPVPKTMTTLFEVLFFYFMVRKKYFLAGFFSVAAALIWQPLALFTIAGFILSIKSRRHWSFICGVLPLPLITVAYFIYHGALIELWRGAVSFNLIYLDTNPLYINIINILKTLLRRYSITSVVVIMGLTSFVFLYKDQRAPKILLWAFPLPIFWSILDFQGSQDMFPLLPFAAIGTGLIFHYLSKFRQKNYISIILLVLIAILPHTYNRFSLTDQLREAEGIRKNFHGRIISIGAPHFMAITGLVNPSRYLFILRGIDRKIEAEFPGGVKGWLQFLEGFQPEVIALGQTRGIYSPDIKKWLNKRYRIKKGLKYFKIYVKKGTN